MKFKITVEKKRKKISFLYLRPFFSRSIPTMSNGTGPIDDSAPADCFACVEAGKYWCEVDSFFGGTSQCVVDPTGGFFNSCDDTEFGSSERTNRYDCTFNSSAGTFILVSIICVSIVLFLLCCFCCCTVSRQSRQFKSQYDPQKAIRDKHNNSQAQNNHMTGIGMQTLDMMAPPPAYSGGPSAFAYERTTTALPAVAVVQPVGPKPGLGQQIANLAQLRDQGVLSEAEFSLAKKKLIS